jgi:hypothetical protein
MRQMVDDEKALQQDEKDSSRDALVVIPICMMLGVSKNKTYSRRGKKKHLRNTTPGRNSMSEFGVSSEWSIDVKTLKARLKNTRKIETTRKKRYVFRTMM